MRRKLLSGNVLLVTLLALFIQPLPVQLSRGDSVGEFLAPADGLAASGLFQAEPQPCDTHWDCPPRQVCDPRISECVTFACTSTGGCFIGSFCDNGQCIPNPCTTHGECPDGMVCDEGRCITMPCTTHEDCPPGSVCDNGQCTFMSCTTHGDCPDGTICEGGRCIPSDLQPCTTHWDCAQGEFCYKGKCLRDAKQAVYHCGKPGCPPGHWCVTQENEKERCAEDPTYVCETACDCGPAHCCKGDICVKDPNDPWIPGGEVIGEPCVQGVDATYCCAAPACYAGASAYKGSGMPGSFRCYNPETNGVDWMCGRVHCFGTACNCSPGESCVDTSLSSTPPGKACWLLTGGKCVSNAIAEAVFGWTSSELLTCCPGNSPASPACDAGWQNCGKYAYQRVSAILSDCGNGVCNPGEYPGSSILVCSGDCSCGDGVCHPEELGVCPDCSECGDGTCDEWEGPASCPVDCTASGGDGWCRLDEHWAYPDDCGCPDAAYYPGEYVACGDGHCRESSREDCRTCPQDCDDCPTTVVGGIQYAGPPVLLSMLLGGVNGAGEPAFAPNVGRGIALHDGKVYLAGQTYALDFPVTDGSTSNGAWDAFVAVVDAGGSLQFASYVDKDSREVSDIARDIAVDQAGNMLVLSGAEVVKLVPDDDGTLVFAETLFGEGGGYGIHAADGYIYAVGDAGEGQSRVVKLDATGDTTYSTEFQGAGYDLTVDGEGNAYVAGGGGVVKLGPGGAILGTTSLPGVAYGIAVQGDSVYVAGRIRTGDLPATQGAFDPSQDAADDAFLAVLDGEGSVLYASYLGGSSEDGAHDLAVDPEGCAYLTGLTRSPDFPTTAGTFDSSLTGAGDIFFARLCPSGDGAQDLAYATFLGGADPSTPPYLMPDRGFAVALDSHCHAYLTGESGSPDFPITVAGGGIGFSDAVLVELFLDVDGDGWAQGCDCDDGDAGIYPGAEEVCDGRDNNCDGQVDGSICGAPTDADCDGVNDCTSDWCLGTTGDDLLEDSLLPKHYADLDADRVFETRNKGTAPLVDSALTLEDTHGCSCLQILEQLPGDNEGLAQHGCPLKLMQAWILGH